MDIAHGFRKFDDGEKKTFRGGWFKKENYGKQWWHFSDVNAVPRKGELNASVSRQVDVKTPPESRVRITSGNYSDGSNGSNGKGMLVRTTPHKAIVLLDEGRGEVALNFASVELDLGSADNRAPPSGETVMKRQKAVPRPSSPEELAYFTKWNDTYGKKLTEAEHNEKKYPQKNNVICYMVSVISCFEMNIHC